jgi:uncharacterized coiled-coil DUF342 family protein
MLPEDKKELFRKQDELRKEVLSLKENLNNIDEEKEAAFSEKETISKDISKIIKEVQAVKQQRNNFTKDVKDLKLKRDTLNAQVAHKIKDIKSMDNERKDIARKHNIQEDPSRIKAQIEQLEQKFETDVFSFEKEKELMKIIKTLKKKYKESNVVSDVWDKLHVMSKDIDVVKKDSHDVHSQIQQKARESQQKHEEMLVLSKQIDELKVREEAAYKKFFEQKQKFNEVNTKLKEKLMGLNQISEEVNAFKNKNKIDRQRAQDDMLKSMEDMVQEKIRHGEKLTTEDLLILQKADDGKL